MSAPPVLFNAAHPHSPPSAAHTHPQDPPAPHYSAGLGKREVFETYSSRPVNEAVVAYSLPSTAGTQGKGRKGMTKTSTRMVGASASGNDAERVSDESGSSAPSSSRTIGAGFVPVSLEKRRSLHFPDGWEVLHNAKFSKYKVIEPSGTVHMSLKVRWTERRRAMRRAKE